MVAEPGAPPDGTGMPVPDGGVDAHAAGDATAAAPPVQTAAALPVQSMSGTQPPGLVPSAPAQAEAAKENPEELMRKMARGLARSASAPIGVENPEEETRKRRPGVKIDRDKVEKQTKDFQAQWGGYGQQQPQQQQQHKGGFGMGSTFEAPGTPTTNGGAQYAKPGYWGESEKKQREMAHLKEVMAAAMTIMREEKEKEKLEKEKLGPKGEGKGDRVKLEENISGEWICLEGTGPNAVVGYSIWALQWDLWIKFWQKH